MYEEHDLPEGQAMKLGVGRRLPPVEYIRLHGLN